MDWGSIIFAALIYVIPWLISFYPRSAVYRIAFTRFGPRPDEGESLVRHQMRWAIYSLDWLGQILVILLLLLGSLHVWPTFEQDDVFSVMFFALSVGMGMAVLAAAYFFLKAGWIRFFGRNLIWEQD